jgi:hypothetical protein
LVIVVPNIVLRNGPAIHNESAVSAFGKDDFLSIEHQQPPILPGGPL